LITFSSRTSSLACLRPQSFPFLNLSNNFLFFPEPYELRSPGSGRRLLPQGPKGSDRLRLFGL